MRVTSLQSLELTPGRLGESFRRPDGTSRAFPALHVEATVAELDGVSAEVDEEERDQRPLAAGCVHVEALRHQGEVCTGRVKGWNVTMEDETNQPLIQREQCRNSYSFESVWVDNKASYTWSAECLWAAIFTSLHRCLMCVFKSDV